MKKTVIIFLLAITAVVAQMSAAGRVSVTAKLDSVSIMMGRLGILHLEVVQDAKAKGGFPMFSGAAHSGVIGICGDSIELRSAFRCDTLELGSGRIQINYAIPVQAFDSGFYRLPAFEYVAGSDTARSNRVSLKVIPVSVGENDPISDYAGVAEPDGKSIFDKLPDVLVDYWWIWLLALLLIAALIYGYIVYKKRGSILPPKPKPTPYEVAILALRRLKERKLWENGMEREYFTELTDILRIYLQDRFGISAMEMTSREIMEMLSKDAEIKDKREYVRSILDMADFVKFARMRPLPADNIASFDNAVCFVEETKPVEKKEEDVDDAQGKVAGDSSQKGGEA